MAIRDNLRKKIVVSGGGGSSGSGTGGSGTSAIDGGYTVNFHNTDGVLIESHSALFGMWIDEPISYTPNSWRNADGYINQLPLVVEADSEQTVFDLYANNDTIIDEIYAHFAIDKEVYPYVYIKASREYPSGSIYSRVDVYISSTNIGENNSVIIAPYYSGYISTRGDWTDINDINEVFAFIKTNIATLNLRSSGSATIAIGLANYCNFDWDIDNYIDLRTI
ncbi:MAG: hypothetical protein ABS949_14715 [Solibacillus sp.]